MRKMYTEDEMMELIAHAVKVTKAQSQGGMVVKVVRVDRSLAYTLMGRTTGLINSQQKERAQAAYCELCKYLEDLINQL